MPRKVTQSDRLKAEETVVVADPQLGFSRKVVAGQLIPHGLEEAYKKATTGAKTKPEQSEPKETEHKKPFGGAARKSKSN